MHLSLPAGPPAVARARREVGRWLADAGVGASDINAVEYAVTELVTNATEHAYRGAPSGQVQIDGLIEPDGKLRLVVTDRGEWRAGMAAPGRGLGLPMLRRLIDHLEIATSPAGTAITVRTGLHRPVRRELKPPTWDPARLEGLAIESTRGSTTHLTLNGVIDDAMSGTVRAVIATLLEPGVRVMTIDLSGVTLLGSAGVRVLHEAIQEAREKKVAVRLSAPSGTIAHEVLTLAALPHSADPV
jgi:anti-anti-sigma factor